MNFRNFFRIKYLLIVLLNVSVYFCGIDNVVAQDVNLNDLGSIEVDQLTNEQVKAFMEKVAESGMSQQQFEIMARTRGMSPDEIAKLWTRMQQSQGTQGGVAETIQTLRDENEPSDLGLLFFESLLTEDSTVSELKIFGQDLFANIDLTFEPSINIPTPKDYQLGPGDELIIDVWGASEQTYQVQISPEGTIRIPNLGPIQVNGLQVDVASNRIISRLSQIYSGLNRSTPNTYAQITIGNLRSIKVNVVGEVKRPGTFTLSSLSTAFNALYFAGGPSDQGSMREIDVYRLNNKIATLDIYDYLINGKQSENIRLNDQDVIIVSPYDKRVTIDGEVKRPGIFESIGSENLAKMIDYAGGFTEKAYRKNLSIVRNTASERTIASVTFEELSNFEVQSGDYLNVKPILERFVNRVQIKGAIYREGEFEFTDSLTVGDLIRLADGLRGDAFLGRGIIVRMKDDLRFSAIDFNVTEVLNGTADISLQSEDLVVIKSIFDLREDYFVSIEGEVIYPGQFPYISDMTVEDVVVLAGGLKASASKSVIEVARRIYLENDELTSQTAEIFTFPISQDLSTSSEASTFSIQPFDLIVIRKLPGYEEQLIIEIQGEVLYPGKYSISKRDERISDVIKRAGGLSAYAFTAGATLIRRTEFFVAKGEKNLNDTDNSEDIDAAADNDSYGVPSEDIDVAAGLRRESLEELSKRDETVSEFKIKEQESIGIQLQKIIRNPGSQFDIILQEGDIISIPRELQTVRLRGALLYPITVRHDNIFSFKDYISHAGGFADTARPGKSYVVYANGSAKRTKKFLWFKNYPKVEPGSEIFVPTKPLNGPRVSVERILALTSSLLTMLLVVDRLTATTP